MAKTVVLDWHTWQPVKAEKEPERLYSATSHHFRNSTASDWASGLTQGALMAYLFQIIEPELAQADVVPALSDGSSMQFSDDASWADYVVPMLKHQGLPLAVTMCMWAGLEMILRKPASAIDRAKWAVVGYLGLQFILPFLTHLGHRFGDA